jgi:xylose isomerase
MVVEHKHRIGFDGPILIEPKPFEPTKHQWDFDVAAVHAFLQRYDLLNDVRVNIEVNHATLSGHDFAHEVEYAAAVGLLGSVDANTGDDRLGWDVDRFPSAIEEHVLALHAILEAGGLAAGGFNFDAKLRRQSVDPLDLFHAHIGGMDTLAKALIVAADMLADGALKDVRARRYSGWDGELGQAILSGDRSLEDLHAYVREGNEVNAPTSGRQEALERLVARYVDRAR